MSTTTVDDVTGNKRSLTMFPRPQFKSFLVALALALASLLVPNSHALAATSYIVDGAGVGCDPFVATHTSIQTAVDDAIANNVRTILVCKGSHDSFTVVNAKKLNIKAAVPGTFPIIDAPAASSGTIVAISDSTGVILDGLKFDGGNFNDTLSGISAGILFEASSGTVQNSSIINLRNFPDMGSNGIGIFIEGDIKKSVVTIKNVNIVDFDLAGIIATDQVKLTVSGARITGNFSGGAGIPDYGIFFDESGVTGSVTGSTISGVSTGLTLQGASKVTISGNNVYGVAEGVSLRADCTPGEESANLNKITNNTITEVSQYGITIASSGGGCTRADKNTISGNRVTGAFGSSIGVYLTMDPAALADRNKITGNSIFGFNEDINIDLSATNTTVSGNSWIP
jgi:hypothetical protein